MQADDGDSAGPATRPEQPFYAPTILAHELEAVLAYEAARERGEAPEPSPPPRGLIALMLHPPPKRRGRPARRRTIITDIADDIAKKAERRRRRRKPDRAPPWDRHRYASLLIKIAKSCSNGSQAESIFNKCRNLAGKEPEYGSGSAWRQRFYRAARDPDLRDLAYAIAGEDGPVVREFLDQLVTAK